MNVNVQTTIANWSFSRLNLGFYQNELLNVHIRMHFLKVWNSASVLLISQFSLFIPCRVRG